MLQDSAAVVAYRVQDAQGNPVSLEINKMVISWMNIPLLFEYQTNSYRRMSSFHATLGLIAGVRIGSYTKQEYENEGQSYFLVDNNGKEVSTYNVDNHIVRNHGAYHLSPFKIDAAFRIGWSHINLFTTYSLTQMFQKDQGPVLYPFTFGITLLGW